MVWKSEWRERWENVRWKWTPHGFIDPGKGRAWYSFRWGSSPLFCTWTLKCTIGETWYHITMTELSAFTWVSYKSHKTKDGYWLGYLIFVCLRQPGWAAESSTVFVEVSKILLGKHTLMLFSHSKSWSVKSGLASLNCHEHLYQHKETKDS